MTFTTQQKAELTSPLSAANVRERVQAGRKLSYIEGWKAIDEANRIFGFDAWSSETIDIRCVSERAREIGQSKAEGWGVSYVAKVRINVDGVIREGVGAGHGIDRDLGLAHESAIKEAETDGRKRALMTFGNPFGLALYDRTQANVEHTNGHALPQDSHDRRPASVDMVGLAAQGRGAALKGSTALRDWWNSLPIGTKAMPEVITLKDQVLKPTAATADANKNPLAAG